MRSHRIDLERRDEHIPLGYNHVARPDLQAAITMLERIPGLGRDINVKDSAAVCFMSQIKRSLYRCHVGATSMSCGR